MITIFLCTIYTKGVLPIKEQKIKEQGYVLSLFFDPYSFDHNLGVACGPRYPLILHRL